MINKCKCGGRIRPNSRITKEGQFFIVHRDSGYAYFKCDKCGRELKQKVRTK